MFPGYLYGGHYGFSVLTNNPRVTYGRSRTGTPRYPKVLSVRLTVDIRCQVVERPLDGGRTSSMAVRLASSHDGSVGDSAGKHHRVGN